MHGPRRTTFYLHEIQHEAGATFALLNAKRPSLPVHKDTLERTPYFLRVVSQVMKYGTKQMRSPYNYLTYSTLGAGNAPANHALSVRGRRLVVAVGRFHSVYT